jgi:hypothetical protein
MRCGLRAGRLATSKGHIHSKKDRICRAVLVTLRFVPHRPDLADDKPKGVISAEYVAFELCGPGEVIVIDAMGWKYSSIGGDIKFLCG